MGIKLTLKVCHQKFNRVKSIIGKILWIILQVGLFVGIIISSIYLITTDGYYKILIFLPLMLCSMGIIFTYFIVPCMDDKPNGLARINNKIKAFEWNEDC